jgi:signal transduction histidine kinase
MPPQSRGSRQRSIRVLLAVIFIVPLASLIGLWIFAASVTVSNAIREHDFTSQDNRYGAAAETLLEQLASERLTAFEWLSSMHHSSSSDAAYMVEIGKTNAALNTFQRGLASSSAIVSSARPALAYFDQQIAGLAGIRLQVEHGTIPPLTAFGDYNHLVDAEFTLYSDLVVVDNTPLYIQAEASVEAGRSVELASREVTLTAGALADKLQMTKAERLVFAQIAATRQNLMTQAIQQLNPALGSGYQRVAASPAYQNFTVLESDISNSVGNKGPETYAVPFSLSAAQVFTEFQSAESQDRLALSSLGTQIGNHLLWEVGLAGGLGLLAVVLSVFLMVRFGRRISRDLTGLQRAALDLAEERLPRVVAALSRGDDVDVAAEAAPLAEGRIAETAKVAEAFSSVQRTAVEAAVGQARLRAGVAQVFRNLAWRSQSLLHRQLTLLDGMERRSTEPETLEELFQLDHLTTRMRRHAEGLIILSGATPGRGWREPVPVMDVLRGAIAEVEDYKRVSVLCESQDAVLGTAVADVIHLLAELIENATTYSPASTEVLIRAERVANGFAIEIEDRGIGIAAEEQAVFNERLANPPEFDLADSNQLGLFVVARLAAKHHIRITLRMSPFGGTSAVILLPPTIVAVSDGSGVLAPGVRVIGNGRELISAGRELPGSGRDGGGNGRDPGGGQDPNGNGRDRGRELAAAGPRDLADAGPALPGAGPAEAAGGPGLVGTGPGFVGTGAGLVGTSAGLAGPGLAGSGPGLVGNGHGHDGPGLVAGGQEQGASGPEFVAPGLEPVAAPDPEPTGAAPQAGMAGAQAFDVFRLNSPPEPRNRADGPASAPWNGRHASPATTDDDSALPEPPTWNLQRGADSGIPLPRRVRQASLAPQLKTDAPLLPESTLASEGDSDGGSEPIGAGPSPADTRALVQSLQFGLELAKKSEGPEEESWSTPADKSWPSSPGESWAPPPSESWPSPAGNPDLAGWPEDDGGQ